MTTAEAPRARSIPSRFMSPAHKRMALMLDFTLTLGTAEAWIGFVTVITARMTVQERACLATAALTSLPDDVEDMVWAKRAEAGGPQPPLLSIMDDARFWASNASRREKKAHLLAIWEATAASDQADFFKYITKQRDRAA